MKSFHIVCVSLSALALSAAAAPVAWTLPFQGVATDSTGRPRPDGVVNVSFELFDAPTAGNGVWLETDAVSLKKGLFSLQLGGTNALPLNLLGRENLWLQLTFGTEPAVSPRIPLGRNVEAWYAHNASMADQATNADTASFVKMTDSSRAAHVSDTAKYALGAPVPDSVRASYKSDTAKYALGAPVPDSVRASYKSDTAKYALGAPVPDSVRVSHKSDTAKYALGAPMPDSVRASHKSDTANYAFSSIGWAVKAPLALSATNDTLKLKPGTASGNFLTWDGTNWVSKTTTYTASVVGGSLPVPIRNPYLGVNYIIALAGIFPTRSGSNPFLGEIELVGFNFAPTGWALCDGQTLAISTYSALFALLGTTYGGNGTTTFQLPNLQSRVPVGMGQGNGLSPVIIGDMSGAENVTITTSQMPAHTHVITASP